MVAGWRHSWYLFSHLCGKQNMQNWFMGYDKYLFVLNNMGDEIPHVTTTGWAPAVISERNLQSSWQANKCFGPSSGQVTSYVPRILNCETRNTSPLRQRLRQRQYGNIQFNYFFCAGLLLLFLQRNETNVASVWRLSLNYYHYYYYFIVAVDSAHK
jgi:hypothetical protein